MNETLTLFLAFLSSLILTAIIIPAVIRTSYKRDLFDHPTEPRKIHTRMIPNLGGVAIFAGFMFCQQLFIQPDILPPINQLLMCGTILFMVGLKDDIVGLSPYKKFFAQTAAALILAVIGGVRITNLQGFLGFNELSDVFSVSLTVFLVVGIVNSFNLIDGIDGLAGMIGIVIFVTYSFFFYYANEPGWTFLCLSFAGALGGFLFYNRAPASIFMGDSGSLMTGFFIAVSTIHLMNTVSKGVIHTPIGDILSANSIAMAALVVPLFDTCRVFILRILDNRSPFEADRNHIHHRLLEAGFNHTNAAILLSGLTLGFLTMSFFLQGVNTNQVVATLAIIVLSLNTGFTLYMNSTERTEKEVDRIVPAPRSEKTVDAAFPEKILDKIFEN